MMAWRVRSGRIAVAALAIALTAGAAAAQAFSAHGSADQVYVTGLARGPDVARDSAQARRP